MTTRSFVDQLGTEISIPYPPRSIVSLVPSQTELLHHLGLDHEVSGVTKFCVHPQGWLKNKTIVGGTKKFSFETIARLKPDLIIGNKEENYQEGIERLRERYPVWVSDIITLEHALEMIASVGALTAREEQARHINETILSAFGTLRRYSGQSVLYLIWKKPWMAAGRDTFIDTMIQRTGLRNSVEQSRYPELSEDEIHSLKPDYVFLSTEPYPFRNEHAGEIHRISPSSKIQIVDGEMFSWYGSRLQQAPAYFNGLLDP